MIYFQEIKFQQLIDFNKRKSFSRHSGQQSLLISSNYSLQVSSKLSTNDDAQKDTKIFCLIFGKQHNILKYKKLVP